VQIVIEMIQIRLFFVKSQYSPQYGFKKGKISVIKQ